MQYSPFNQTNHMLIPRVEIPKLPNYTARLFASIDNAKQREDDAMRQYAHAMEQTKSACDKATASIVRAVKAGDYTTGSPTLDELITLDTIHKGSFLDSRDLSRRILRGLDAVASFETEDHFTAVIATYLTGPNVTGPEQVSRSTPTRLTTIWLGQSNGKQVEPYPFKPADTVRKGLCLPFKSFVRYDLKGSKFVFIGPTASEPCILNDDNGHMFQDAIFRPAKNDAGANMALHKKMTLLDVLVITHHEIKEISEGVYSGKIHSTCQGLVKMAFDAFQQLSQ